MTEQPYQSASRFSATADQSSGTDRSSRQALARSVSGLRSSNPLLASVAVLSASLLGQPLIAGTASALTAGPLKAATGTDAGMLRVAADAFKVEDVKGARGEPLPLKVQLPPNPTVTYSFLMFRNMPPKFTLSAGFGAKDYWAVSLHDIKGLQVIPPDDYEGSFTLEVLLVKGMGADPDRRTADVVIAGQPSVTGRAVSSSDENKLLTASRPDETTASLPPLGSTGRAGETLLPSQEMTAIDESMMERGNTYLQQGDIAAARLLYRQLAKKGIAAGALAMGHTYDPGFLANLPIRGLRPDVEQAKNWYRMAEELGSSQAARRLATLDAGGN